MKIAVDVMGGDFAPDEILVGCVEALKRESGFNLVLFGDRGEIEKKLTQYSVKADRIEIIGTSEVITNDEAPTIAIKTKKDSSLVRAFEYTKNEEECIGMVSAGSTGAVLIGATLKIGRIKGINRPALAPMLPTILGGKVLLLDCGANVDCKSHMLYQFAIMGNAYMQSVCGIDKPKIGLLCNGTEDKKGNDLTKETFALLKADDNIDFVGNMEARDILTGNYDVVVADGFNGNIALKSAEGTATMMLKLLKREMMANLWTKIGAAILKKPFMRVKKIMDYNQSGGAPFVGVSKPIIKSHGASKAESICGSIMQVLEMHKSKLIEKIEGALNDRNPQ